MPGGVNIEPNPDPRGWPASAAAAPLPWGFGALTALQASGHDSVGHCAVTLDGRGRLTEATRMLGDGRLTLSALTGQLQELRLL